MVELIQSIYWIVMHIDSKSVINRAEDFGICRPPCTMSIANDQTHNLEHQECTQHNQSGNVRIFNLNGDMVADKSGYFNVITRRLIAREVSGNTER